jgi:undecaprenyl pyrophosphate phosphatase UppP
MSQPPDDRLKALWQGQDTETPTMTAQALRMLVNDQHSAARRATAARLTVGALCAAVFIGCAWTAPNTLVRTGDLVMLAWTPGMLWFVWRRWPARMPGGEASAAGLIDFYRAQVVRQAPDLRLIAAMLIPVFAGLAVVMAGVWAKASRLHFAPLIPIAVLLAIWAVAFILQLRRQRRRVRDRLRELDALRGG